MKIPTQRMHIQRQGVEVNWFTSVTMHLFCGKTLSRYPTAKKRVSSPVRSEISTGVHHDSNCSMLTPSKSHLGESAPLDLKSIFASISPHPQVGSKSFHKVIGDRKRTLLENQKFRQFLSPRQLLTVAKRSSGRKGDERGSVMRSRQLQIDAPDSLDRIAGVGYRPASGSGVPGFSVDSQLASCSRSRCSSSLRSRSCS